MAKSKRKVGDISEKRAAKKVNAKTIRGSGSLWYNKGDYETNDIVYQNKCTFNSFYNLRIADLEKAKKDALSKNKDFIFSIDIQGDFYYVFERILISEEMEVKLNLKTLEVKKQLKINQERTNTNLLINEKYIFINEFDYLNEVFSGK